MASAGETGALLPRGEEAEFASCYPNVWYRRYILLLLFLIATLQTTDRNIPAILLPKMGPEFHMSDAGAGMLNGAAFVFIYALATIPLARIADMCGRKNLLAGSLIVWSTLTSLSGLSQNTFQLCVLRVGIGLGEAGCTPRRSLSSPSCTVLVSAPAPWPSSSSASPPACPPRTSSGACSSIASGGEGSLA